MDVATEDGQALSLSSTACEKLSWMLKKGESQWDNASIQVGPDRPTCDIVFRDAALTHQIEISFDTVHWSTPGGEPVDVGGISVQKLHQAFEALDFSDGVSVLVEDDGVYVTCSTAGRDMLVQIHGDDITDTGYNRDWFDQVQDRHIEASVIDVETEWQDIVSRANTVIHDAYITVRHEGVVSIENYKGSSTHTFVSSLFHEGPEQYSDDATVWVSMKYLKPLVAASAVIDHDHRTIYTGSDAPLLVEENASNLTLRYMVAPRIDE